jgi:hypothetical protein
MAGYIGSKASVVSSGVERKKTYNITGSTTSLTGLNYTVGKVHVYQNGVRLLDGTDYTATNGTSITLTVAAQSGDNVVVVSQASFQLSESYTSTEADAEFVTKTGDTMTGNLSFGDSDKAIFGAGSDLQIFHDGNNSFINELGTGNLTIKSSNVLYLMSGDSEPYATFTANGAATLYYDNAAKLATTSTGIDITGTVTSDAYALDNVALPSAGTPTIFNRNTDNNLYIQTGSGNTLNVLDGSQNTMYQITPTSHIFQISNAEKMRIDSSGNVGIGVVPNTFSSGYTALQLNGYAYNIAHSGGDHYITNNAYFNSGWKYGRTSTAQKIEMASGRIWLATAASGSADSAITWSTGLNVDSSGNVGIGTSSPVTNLDVVTTAAGTKARIRSNTTNAPTAGLELCRGTTSTFGADNYTDFLIENVNGGNLAFKSGINGTTSERMRIDSSGNLLVGKTSASIDVDGFMVHNSDYINSTNTSGSAAYFNRKGTDGDIVNFQNDGSSVGSISVSGSSTAYNTSSDYRLKENVVDLTGASARVNQLDVKRFNFIADDTNTLVDGFLAHEVADVVPEAITGTKDAVDDDGNPEYQGIDQSKLVPLLTAALQEALTEIASLKTRVQALEDV